MTATRSARLKGFPDRHVKAQRDFHGEGWLHHFKASWGLVNTGGTALFVGPPGTGKTQMATEIARRIQPITIKVHGMGKEQPCIYLTMDDLLTNAKRTWQDSDAPSEHTLFDELKDASLVVIDEIGSNVKSEFGQRTIARVQDDRYQKMRPLILITNEQKNRIKYLLPDKTRDRIRESGRGFHFDWPSFRKPTQ